MKLFSLACFFASATPHHTTRHYTPAGAIVDREFTFSVHRFSPVAAVVRVVYPDLVVDLKAVEVFESVSFLPTSDSTVSGTEEAGEDERRSKYKNTDVAHVAHIDCVPVVIPLGEKFMPV